MLKGFKKFILRGNVIDLAVGVVVGAAFNSVVQAFVKDILTPLIGVIGGQPDFSSWQFSIRNSTFMIGNFFNSVLSFLIISAVIYFLIIKPINTLNSFLKQEKIVDIKKCPYCLSTISNKATKCAFCTADLKKKN